MLDDRIKKIYLGGSEVQKMYLGENLIYPREPAVDDYVMLGTTTGSTDFMIGSSTRASRFPDCIKVHVVQKPDGNNDMYVKQEDILKTPFNFSLKAGFNSIEGKKITSISKWRIDTSNVTTMYKMFNNCLQLTSLDLSSFNTTKVTNMSFMFSYCASLTSVDLSNFDTSNVINMSGMFDNCQQLSSLDVSSFDTGNVTTMNRMFSGCYALKTLDIRNFDTTNLVGMSGMFDGDEKLSSLDLSSFNTTKVTNMSSMFSGCMSLTSLDLRNFDTTNLGGMSSMFLNCNNLNKLLLSSNFFNSTNVTEYEFSELTSWTDAESLAKFVEAITARDGAGKTVKLSDNTKNALTKTQKDAITAKGWTIA